MKTLLNPDSTIARFGGDEFMLLLPSDDLIHAIQAAERIRDSIECLSIPSLERNITCSFGVVEISPEDTFVSAFERADNFLLEAKKSGKNQVKPDC